MSKVTRVHFGFVLHKDIKYDYGKSLGAKHASHKRLVLLPSQAHCINHPYILRVEPYIRLARAARGLRCEYKALLIARSARAINFRTQLSGPHHRKDRHQLKVPPNHWCVEIARYCYYHKGRRLLLAPTVGPTLFGVPECYTGTT